MQSLSANPKWLFFGRALTETKTMNAIVNLFYLARGVTVGEIFTLSLVFSLASLVSEIPTGYLADRFGRKKTLLLGVFFLILFNLGVFFAHGMAQFGLLIVLLAFSGSCFSGTEEALLYDSLKETKCEKKMTAYNGQLHAARSIFKIFLPALGALIAAQLLDWQFLILIGIDVLASLGAVWCFMQIVEPSHHTRVLKREVNIIRQSLTTLHEHPFLFRAAMNKTLVFIGGVIMWRMYQPVLSDAGVVAAGLALFYFLMHVIAFLLRFYSGKIERTIPTPKLLVLTVLITIAGLAVFLATNEPWILFTSMLISILAEVAREPLFAHEMNRRIASESRATTLSNLNIVKGILDIPILIACSAISIIDPKYPALMVIAVCVIAITAFPIREHDAA